MNSMVCPQMKPSLTLIVNLPIAMLLSSQTMAKALADIQTLIKKAKKANKPILIDLKAQTLIATNTQRSLPRTLKSLSL